MPDPNSRYRWLKRSLIWSVLAVFVLIFVGALVRATGSGMGCPDWPKCYGQWVPPTEVSQLPPDYRERFAAPGKPVAEFNVYHTYTEYVNRLIGVLTGLFVTASFGLSFLYFRSKPSLFWLCLSAWVLTGFQGWIGAKVVDSNLAGYMVTIHMFIALVILAVLLLAYYLLSREEQGSITQSGFQVRHKVLLLLLVTVLQVLGGTQVREMSDHVFNADLLARLDWLKSWTGTMGLHKLGSILVSAFAAWLYWKHLRQEERHTMVYKASVVMILSLLAQMLTGILNVAFDLPWLSQILHLWFGSILFGALLILSLRLYTAPVRVPDIEK